MNATELQRLQQTQLQTQTQTQGTNSNPVKEEGVSIFSEIKDQVVDFFNDEDKTCTDGNNDGKLSFKEGFTSFMKGLFGGIPKAIIKHPIATIATAAAGAGLMMITGGAAAPILWGVGAALAAQTTASGIIGYIKADNDANAKAALEQAGTGTAGLIAAGATKSSALKTAQNAGVDTSGNFGKILLDSVERSGKNAKNNLSALGNAILYEEKPGAYIYNNESRRLTRSGNIVKLADMYSDACNETTTSQEFLHNLYNSGIDEDMQYILTRTTFSNDPNVTINQVHGMFQVLNNGKQAFIGIEEAGTSCVAEILTEPALNTAGAIGATAGDIAALIDELSEEK